ncbi:EPIDERMAL PATTERNING FACTOR-like protein 1 [Manihot esculenta]|uniref:Epidermal patterning factor-like protein n=1 Tax=Manihot esculenta TaxID=3983 RepID=A0A2C9UW43_MANES|nr:EPIDERMAL PATTERNING FACTOR-like protein 1 [Manihot esculenta]OAY35806.1 hypothetical protein MANES_12G132000v8 [Manihot esculenta]
MKKAYCFFTIMSTHRRYFLSNSGIAIAASLCLLLLLLLPLASCSHPRPQPRGLLSEEKTRLGSTPPSCHNKCNGCHPCMAVQVPTIPSHSRVQPSLAKSLEFLDPYPSPSGNRYSNYKPLGWKCRCGGHFYNP